MSNTRTAVLIADDEERISGMASEFLTRVGYSTSTASDFPSTYKELEDNPEKYGLIILDYNMPGGIGDEAYYRIREIDPFIVVMLSTGEYIGEKLLNDIKFNKDFILQKPYRLAGLAEMVKEALSV